LRVFWVNGNPNPNFGGTELHTVSMLKHLKDFFDITLICARGSFVDQNTDFVKKTLHTLSPQPNTAEYDKAV